tara:strand:+ start:1 stop:1062 length:1062 start_codon:yes stop_codon:yes gene_type:complete
MISPSSIIFDESTTIANPKAAITKAALAIHREFNVPSICLAGNPMPENPRQLWAQFEAAYVTNPLGLSYYQFLRRWFIKVQYGYVLKHNQEDNFQRLLDRWSCSMTESEYALLSKKKGIPYNQYILEYYNLQPEQQSLLEQLFSEWELPDSSDQIETYNYVITLMQKAQEICSGFYYDSNKEPVYFPLAPNPKVELLRSIIEDLIKEDPLSKIVVWRAYKEEDLILRDALDNFHVMTGPDYKALACFESYSAPNILIMPVQCSQGLNELAVASTQIFFSNSFSQEMRNQAVARLERMGNPHSFVRTIDLSSHTGRDAEVIAALWAKDLTRARLVNIVKDFRNYGQTTPQKASF